MITEKDIKERLKNLQRALALDNPSERREAILYARVEELEFVLQSPPSEVLEADGQEALLKLLLGFILEMFPEESRRPLLEDLLNQIYRGRTR